MNASPSASQTHVPDGTMRESPSERVLYYVALVPAGLLLGTALVVVGRGVESMLAPVLSWSAEFAKGGMILGVVAGGWYSDRVLTRLLSRFR